MRHAIATLALACGLLASPPTSAAPAAKPSLHGTIQGGGQAAHLIISALTDPDLRHTRVVAMARVHPQSGSFRLTLPNRQPVTLIVTAGCAPELLQHARFPCRRFFPRRTPVAASDTPLTLQIPDLALTQRLWQGAAPPKSPLQPIGIGLIALLLALAALLWRRGQPATPLPAMPLPAPPHVTWHLVALVALTAALLLPNLGREPLDLLEYSYFHEGLRPTSAAAVLTDFISAELAHGPLTPLTLRALAGLSHSPWLLRLPSLLFGLLWIALVFAITRRALRTTHAALAAALTAAVAPVAVYYARDATPYALAALAGAAALYAALRARSSARPAAWWALFVLAHWVGFFSHYGYAFVGLATVLALTLAWWRPHPRALAQALLATAAAATLPVALANHLAHMFAASGVRFALMSPVYPQSPGLLRFVADFLTVLTGLPKTAPWGLLLTLPTIAFGLHLLWRRSRLLALVCALQALFIALFLVFAHHLSTTTGGGRIFYAYRWTRPLLMGLVIPLGVALTHRRARWPAALALLAAAWQSAGLIIGPTRPAQAQAQAQIAAQVQPGDALAVLPAAFYGDPTLYHLTQGRPPALITAMRTFDLPLHQTTLRAPIVDLPTTFETAIDRLQYRRIWVLAFDERMFGTPKFSPQVTAAAIAWMDQHLTRDLHRRLPFLDLYRYHCDAACAWRGQTRLSIPLDDSLASNRYLVAPPGIPEPSFFALTPVHIAAPPGARVTLLRDGRPVPNPVHGTRLNLATPSGQAAGRDGLRLIFDKVSPP